VNTTKFELRSQNAGGKLTLPSAFFLPALAAGAWINYVTSHITTIGEIERVTGIDFLPGVTGVKRTQMENFRAPALWPKE
jgi:hypothetical protein